MPGRSQSALSRYLGFSSAAIVNRMCKGERDISASEADGIAAYLGETGPYADTTNSPDVPEVDPHQAYVEVEVLPTYAGMGGGGTGDSDRQVAMISRHLVENDLRARATDLLIVNVRGDSMLDPETGKGFQHDDQVLIDRRDVNPVQPGAFALWDGDGYVLKNVERNPKTRRYRVFSNNPAYREHEFEPDEVQIMGRPVWFARRL